MLVYSNVANLGFYKKNPTEKEDVLFLSCE